MQYQKRQTGHAFIEEQPIPSRQELIDRITHESIEIAYGPAKQAFRENPVRVILGYVYFIAAIVLIVVFPIHGNFFGMWCAISALVLPMLLFSFTPANAKKATNAVRIFCVLLSLVLIGITVCVGLSQFGAVEFPPISSSLADSDGLIACIIAFGIILFPALFFFLQQVTHGIRESKRNVEVLATCIGYDCELVVHRRKEHIRTTILYYTPVYHYTTDMGEFTAVSEAHTKNPDSLPQIGETCTIWHHPQRHDEIRITEKSVVSWGLVTVLGIFIAILIGAFLYVWTDPQIDVPMPPDTSSVADSRQILNDSNLDKLAQGYTWTIALRTVTEIRKEDDGSIVIMFEPFGYYNDGIRISAKSKGEYASVKAGDTMYWVESPVGTAVFATDRYRYQGSNPLEQAATE